MSGGYGWQRLIGETIEPGYSLQALVRSEMRMATFAARNEAQNGAEVLLTAIRCATEECDLYFRRFMEAKFFRHPNVMAVLNAGQAKVNGTDLTFVVTEPGQYTLQSALPLDREAVWNLCRDLLAGLGYLHSENLVYCALRDETTWRVGDHWKLGDFHQLRLSGKGRIAETRALMGRMPETPPEAFEGIVTPAWDVWSFGVTVAKVLHHGARDRHAGTLGEPFESIVNRCLDSNPTTRITVAELTEQFASPLPPAVETHHAATVSGSAESLESAVPNVETFVSRRKSEHSIRRRRWLPFAVAGAIAGTALTLVAIRRETTPPKRTAAAPTTETSAVRAPRTPEPKPDPTAPAVSQEADRMQSSNPQEGIRTLLETWVESIRRRDVATQVRLYAPTVDTFYGRHRLNQDQIRAEKQKQFAAIGRIRNFNVSDVRIRQINPSLAVVAFKKDWDFGAFAGSEQDELIVRLLNGQWKISSERGRKLYWVRRPNETTS